MPGTAETHLTRATREGVLVLTIRAAQLQGDRLLTALRHDLEQAIGWGEAGDVVLDLRHVQSLSSAALRPLLSLRRDLEERGRRLVLCELSPAVTGVFRAVRVIGGSRASAAVFEVQPDLDAAVTHLGRAAGAAGAGGR
jgi:anti-anti-sigma factor